MHCRSYLLIEKELATFRKSNSQDIQAIQTFEGNIFHWTVRITGPEHTAWEGGIFKLILLFNEYFNYYPPAIVFITIPFHPNIDPITGRLSMDLLDDPDAWTPDTSIFSLLEAVRSLLAQPSASFVVNSEAEDLARQDPGIYQHLVSECVTVSRRLDEPLVTRSAASDEGRQPAVIEYDEAFVAAMNAREATQKPAQHTAQVSFEDYFATWSGIATSKTEPQQKNPHLSTIEGQAALLTIHHGVKFEEIEDHLTRQLEQHKSYMYGNFTKKPKQSVEIRDAKLERIEQMRKIYLSQKTPSNLTRRDRTLDSIGTTPQPADVQVAVGGNSESKILEHTAPPTDVAPDNAVSDTKPPSPGAPAAKSPSPGAPAAKPPSPGVAAAKSPSPGAPTAKPPSPGEPGSKTANETFEGQPSSSAAAPVLEVSTDSGSIAVKDNLDPSAPAVLIRETTDLPPDDEVDALAAWSQNLGEE